MTFFKCVWYNIIRIYFGLMYHILIDILLQLKNYCATQVVSTIKQLKQGAQNFFSDQRILSTKYGAVCMQAHLQKFAYVVEKAVCKKSQKIPKMEKSWKIPKWRKLF